MTDNEAREVAWARQHARELRAKAASSSDMDYSVHSRALGAAGIEFLRQQAPRSVFYSTADFLFTIESGLNLPGALEQLAGLLEDWANFVTEDFARAPYEVRARVDAATDLMEQAQALLEDERVAPVAPVVLAGAALEELLRSLVSAHDLTIAGRAGISSYAGALRKAEILTALDATEITGWAAQRNQAAHGHFEQLSKPRAQIMVEGINFFMSRHSPLWERPRIPAGSLGGRTQDRCGRALHQGGMPAMTRQKRLLLDLGRRAKVSARSISRPEAIS